VGLKPLHLPRAQLEFQTQRKKGYPLSVFNKNSTLKERLEGMGSGAGSREGDRVGYVGVKQGWRGRGV